MHDDSPSSLPPFSGALQNARSRMMGGGGGAGGAGSNENLSLMRGQQPSSAAPAGYVPTTPVYSEKGHAFSSAPGPCAPGAQRNKYFAALVLATLLACVWLWNHPVHFRSEDDAQYNEGSGLRPADLQGNGEGGLGSHSQTMRALSLAALDAGRPAPLGVSYQCPAPQPCPVPLCPTQEASVSAAASCPKCDTFAAAADEKECPVCPPPRKCPKQAECPVAEQAKADATSCGAFCSEQAAASKDLSLPPYLAPRLAAMQRSAGMLSPAPHDLSTKRFRPADHEATWEYCESTRKLKAHTSLTRTGLALCPEDAKNEWWWQLKWYERTDSKNKTAKIPRAASVRTPRCAQLPPEGYVFPEKYPALPMTPSKGQPMATASSPGGKVDPTALSHGLFPWRNLRMQRITDMLDFNAATPKNLYHFDAPQYDRQQKAFLDEITAVIPFEQKVRLMLDVGAGGASLGLLLKRLYDVQTVSTVFADWPYCEYITERGGLCMLLDAMIAFPFAKFSYDVVHTSWIFHGVYPADLFEVFQEQNRILRPGGYLWWVGGWSVQQMEALQGYARALGYRELYSDAKKVSAGASSWKFGTKADIPYEVDWTVVWLKPLKAVPVKC